MTNKCRDHSIITLLTLTRTEMGHPITRQSC